MIAVAALVVYLTVAVFIFRITLAAGWRRWYNLTPPVAFSAYTALVWPFIIPTVVMLGVMWKEVLGDYRPTYYHPDHEKYPALLRWARVGKDFYPLGPSRYTANPPLITRKDVTR